MFLPWLVIHSAKGSEWEEHKYIKKIDGDYYYPDDYEGGRHLSTSQKKSNDEKLPIETTADLDQEMVENLARSVITGIFGNGQVRKDLLGENYQIVQDRVNEILRSSMSSISSEVKTEAKETLEKIVSSTETKVNSVTSSTSSTGKITKTAGQIAIERASKRVSNLKRFK